MGVTLDIAHWNKQNAVIVLIYIDVSSLLFIAHIILSMGDIICVLYLNSISLHSMCRVCCFFQLLAAFVVKKNEAAYLDLASKGCCLFSRACRFVSACRSLR